MRSVLRRSTIAQLDYFSRKLATCSSDRLIKVYDITPDEAVMRAADIAR